MVTNNPAVAKDSSHAEILRSLNKLLTEYAQLKASLGLSPSAGLKEAIAAVNKPNMTPAKTAHLIKIIKKELEGEKNAIASRLKQLLDEEQEKLEGKVKKRELSEAEAQQQLAFYQQQIAKRDAELKQLHQDVIRVFEEAEQAITANRTGLVTYYNTACAEQGLPEEAQITPELEQRCINSTEEEQQQVLTNLRTHEMQPGPYKGYAKQVIESFDSNNSISVMGLYVVADLINLSKHKPNQAQSAFGLFFAKFADCLKKESGILQKRDQDLVVISAKAASFGGGLKVFSAVKEVNVVSNFADGPTVSNSFNSGGRR